MKWPESDFNQFLEVTVNSYSDISNAGWIEELHYSIRSGGKRFRPALLYHASQPNHVEKETVFRMASAVELLHTASLIHDDLPQIDDDDYRRGHPSHHKVYGEGMAVVSADYLFFLAFTVLSDIMSPELSRYFSQVSRDLAYGEALDINYEVREDVSEKEVLKMYRLKTARLIEFSIASPAVLMQQDKRHIELVKSAGEELGIAFQIMDDLKDRQGSLEELGKTPGKDIKHGKKTLIGNNRLEAFEDRLESKKVSIYENLREIKRHDQTDYTLLLDFLEETWNTIKKR